MGVDKVTCVGLPRRRVGDRASLATGLAAGGFHSAPVSIQHRLRGHVSDRGGRGGSFTVPLVPEKAKEFVLLNRSANRAAKLISFQAVVRVGKEITGVDVAVAQELEQVPVKSISAGLGDNVHYRAGMQPITSRKAVGLNAEFLKGIGEGEGEIDIREGVIIVSAVHQIIRRIRLSPRDRN